MIICDFLHQIARTSEYFLAPLGDRWLHVQGVAEKAKQVSIILDSENATCLVAAAYLHDIGYAPALKNTGFHPIDGAQYILSLGYQRLASLTAYHSEARFEARLRGLEKVLNEFKEEKSLVSDALIYCDLTTGPAGQTMTLEERVRDVLCRYGENHIVSHALHESLPSLTLAVERIQDRLHLARRN